MDRRRFLGKSMAGGMLLQGAAAAQEIDGLDAEGGGGGSTSYDVNVTVERKQPGRPHAGKVLAAIQPHCDDVPIYAGGTVLKLIEEGYTGYMINVTDDSMAGEGRSIGDIVLKNEDDTVEATRLLGLKEVIFLNYPNHNLDAWPIVELRARLVFLFRLLKVDTVVTYDPSGLYERNPDHSVVAKAVESAAWMARSEWDYPEHFRAGLTAHGPQEKYYFSRGPQLVNRVVDISEYMDAKVEANIANDTQGPAGTLGARLRKKLAAEGKKLAMLGGDDDSANRAYTKNIALHRDRLRGREHGLEHAEFFHYIPAEASYTDALVERYAEPI